MMVLLEQGMAVAVGAEQPIMLEQMVAQVQADIF